MKGETRGAAFEVFVGLKSKMYLFLVENSEHKKAKVVNTNRVATICHKKYKNVLFINKCLRHSVNRIQSKEHQQNMKSKSRKCHCLVLMTIYTFVIRNN